MSTRGRMPSADCTRIVILGLLCRHGPQYGYELRKRIVDQNLNDLADVQLGSIYAALKKLAREGLLEEHERSRAGNRPTRTAFRVTELGRKELRSLIEHAFENGEQPERPVDLAVHFSGLLPQDEVVELLESRLRELDAFGRRIERAQKITTHDDPAVRELIRDLPEHFRLINRAEIAWTKRVLEHARGGAYRTGSVELT